MRRRRRASCGLSERFPRETLPAPWPPLLPCQRGRGTRRVARPISLLGQDPKFLSGLLSGLSSLLVRRSVRTIKQVCVRTAPSGRFRRGRARGRKGDWASITLLGGRGSRVAVKVRRKARKSPPSQLSGTSSPLSPRLHVGLLIPVRVASRARPLGSRAA